MTRLVATTLGFCLFAIAFAGSAQAKPVDQSDIANCRTFADAQARLRCFDNLANASTQRPESTGEWRRDERTSDLDHSRSVAITLPADRAASGRAQGNEVAGLTIRCAEKVTSIYVAYSSLASNSGGATQVRFRVGESPPQVAEWDGSQDSKAYGLWTSSRSIPFIKNLLSAPDFFIRGQARVFGTTEALFKLSGLPEAIKPIREVCKW